jgi:MinD superfamily P-loop ATPase
VKEIAVTGEKGGVGKSTVAILLANKFVNEGKRVILADCDVECPNDHLILGTGIGEPVDEVYAQFPKLDPEKCQKCGLCVRSCYSHAVYQLPGQPPTFIEELCSGCGLCWHLCPNSAISPRKKIIGKIFENKVSDRLGLVTGQTYGVVEESGPVVSRVKDYSRKLANELAADYLIVDTSVGLHCGVIRALMGANLVYAVTEPTPLGAHDLKLILDLAKTLGLSSEIILNQADLGNKALIEKVAKEEKIKISIEVSYSKDLAHAYAQGKLVDINLL